MSKRSREENYLESISILIENINKKNKTRIINIIKKLDNDEIKIIINQHPNILEYILEDFKKDNKQETKKELEINSDGELESDSDSDYEIEDTSVNKIKDTKKENFKEKLISNLDINKTFIARSYLNICNLSFTNIARLTIWYIFENELIKHKRNEYYITFYNVSDNDKFRLINFYFDNIFENLKSKDMIEEYNKKKSMMIEIMKIKFKKHESRKNINEDETKILNNIVTVFTNAGIDNGSIIKQDNYILDLEKYYRTSLKNCLEKDSNCIKPLFNQK
jgi:hypothetical protein